MLTTMTRSRVIQVWFAAVVVIAVAVVALGVSMSGATAAVLIAMSLVPPVVVLLLWPRVEPPTAAEVLHGG